MNAPTAIPRARADLESHAELTFARVPGGRSFLARQYVPYPFHITRPFYLDATPSDLATVYLQSASGGAYRGDRLSLTVALEEEARAQVTTQASTLVNAGRGGTTRLGQVLRVGPQAHLEYLPDPLILMAEADCENRTEIHLEEGATLILCEAFLTHDFRGEGRLPERFRSELRISEAGGRLLLVDRILLGRSGYDFRQLGERPCCASFLVCTPGPHGSLLAALREELAACTGIRAGCSSLADDRGLFVRLTASGGAAMTRALAGLWRRTRLDLFGVEPAARRK